MNSRGFATFPSLVLAAVIGIAVLAVITPLLIAPTKHPSVELSYVGAIPCGSGAWTCLDIEGRASWVPRLRIVASLPSGKIVADRVIALPREENAPIKIVTPLCRGALAAPINVTVLGKGVRITRIIEPPKLVLESVIARGKVVEATILDEGPYPAPIHVARVIACSHAEKPVLVMGPRTVLPGQRVAITIYLPHPVNACRSVSIELLAFPMNIVQPQK